MQQCQDLHTTSLTMDSSLIRQKSNLDGGTFMGTGHKKGMRISLCRLITFINGIDFFARL